MKKLLLLAVAVGITGCETTSVEQAWSETGHPMPDIWCHDYYNVSVPPKPTLYAYKEEPHSGRLLYPDGRVIKGAYEKDGSTMVWTWKDDPFADRPAASFRITNRWEGFVDDGSVMAQAKKHGAKNPEYRCFPYR